MNKRLIIILSIVAVVILGVGVAINEYINQSSPDLKPVIYLYPQEDNTDVSLVLDYNGAFTQLDPAFNIDSGWRVTANTDGTITLGDKSYEYLYWEGIPNVSYDFYSGFCIKGEDTEAFLDEKLTSLGLNDSEKQAFIEYWLPQMKDNPYNVVAFQTRTYTDNARFLMAPTPDTLIRVFMAWYPSDRYINIHEQLLDRAPERNGFTVVEWGGNKVK